MIDNNKKKNVSFSNLLSIIFIFSFFIFSFSSVSSVSDNAINHIPDKVLIKHKLLNNEHIYEASNVKIKSHSDNTINIQKARINKNYVSISDYSKKNNEPFEVSFYTGNNGVKYSVYKTDLIDVSPQNVRDSGFLYQDVYSYDGYVKVNVSGFSTVLLSMPDIIIPFYNTANVRLAQYFDTSFGFDHFEIEYYDVNTSIQSIVVGESSNNGDVFEVALSEPSTDFFVLNITMYETIFPYQGNYLPDIKVIACDDVGCTSSVEELFYIETPSIWNYYNNASSPFIHQGLHVDMVDFFDFNNNINHPDQSFPMEYSRFNEGVQYPSTPSSWSSTLGIIEGAYDFDGSTDNVNLSSNTLLSGSDVSLGFWMKTTQSISNQRVISAYDGVTFTSGILQNPYTMWINGNNQWDFSENSSWNDGNYHYTVLTYENGVGIKYYFDALLTDSTSSTYGSVTNGISNYHLGSDSNGANYFDGVLDEVVVFDKVLTIDEIAYLYNAGDGREFHQLNNPASLQSSFCFATEVGNCGSSLQTYYGDLQVGETDIYLDNYFNQELGYFYNYVVTFHDYTTSQTLNITHGQSYLGDYFDLSLDNNDIFTIDFKENDEARGFDADIYAYSSYDAIDSIIYTLDFPITGSTYPPNEIRPISVDWNTVTGFDLFIENLSLNLNTHYGNWTDVNLTYYDNNQTNQTFFIILNQSILDSSIITEIGNLTVVLDPTQVTNNIIIDVYPTNESITYDGTFGINISNTLGSIYREFTVEYVFDNPLIKRIIENQTVEIEDDFVLDLNDYFYNFSYSELNFSYNNISYFINSTEPCNNITCPLPIEGINKITLDDFIIGLDGEGNFLFAALQNELNLSVFLFSFDNFSNSANQNFYVITVKKIPPLRDYNGLKSMFPVIEDTLTAKWTAFVIIIVVFVLCFLFIGPLLQYNLLWVWITCLLTLFADFVVCWADYAPWSWFIIPIACILGYFVLFKGIGGSS